jgi:hypothetical protein
MANSFSNRKRDLRNRETHPNATSVLPPQCHTAIHLLYDDRLHTVELDTLSEIPAILEQIGDALGRKGIRVCQTGEVIELQGRATFFKQASNYHSANSDLITIAAIDRLNHPRRFGFL